MTRPALDAATVQRAVSELDGWLLRDGKLYRELTFPGFTEAFGFMTALALHAQALDHHPDWHNVYNRVQIELWTHDAGGLTELDFELARRANGLYARFTR